MLSLIEAQTHVNDVIVHLLRSCQSRSFAAITEIGRTINEWCQIVVLIYT
jgi:hypothetical protein